MNILEHPIYKAIYDLCRQIERFPASEQQTKTVVMASNLEIPAKELLAERNAIKTELERVKKEKDEAKAWSEDLAKQCCEMEDALGFKNDQTDKDGAFVPTIGPWKERVRDLIAKEGELGDLQSRCEQLEAKCAEMRDSLVRVSERSWFQDQMQNEHEHVKHALSSNCGKDFEEERKELREMLRYIAYQRTAVGITVMEMLLDEERQRKIHQLLEGK